MMTFLEVSMSMRISQGTLGSNPITSLVKADDLRYKFLNDVVGTTMSSKGRSAIQQRKFNPPYAISFNPSLGL